MKRPLFARRFGCACSDCPFLGDRRGPVDDDLTRHQAPAHVTIVHGSPSRESVRKGEAVSGFNFKFFADIERALSVDHVFALACREPDGDWRDTADWLYRHRSAISKDKIVSPLLCCRPRLEKRLESADVVITLGPVALRAVAEVEGVRVGKLRSRMDERTITPLEDGQRGHPFVLPSGRVLMPTLDPAECLYGRRHLLHVIRDDVSRALAWRRR